MWYTVDDCYLINNNKDTMFSIKDKTKNDFVRMLTLKYETGENYI